MAEGYRVNVTGAAELANRLKRFDKDAYKILADELAKAGDIVAADARERVPGDGLSGWGKWLGTRRKSSKSTSGGSLNLVTAVVGRDVSFDQSSIRGGIKAKPVTTTRRGNKNSLRVIVQQSNAAGAIFEIAGTQTPDSTFNANLINKRGGGHTSRTLAEALYSKGHDAGDAIQDALNAAILRDGLD